MATPTNVELWNGIRAAFPQFASHTSQGTAELFTANGYEALKQTDIQALDDYFTLSVKVYTQFINEDRAKDPLLAQDFGEQYDVPFGAIIQRLSVEPVLPVSPSYKGLKNFDSPDPAVVYKPEVSERFFKQNFDYQSLISIPDDYTYKVIFTDPTGMGNYLQSQIMNALEAGYTTQKYENKKQALNAYLNSTKNPLKETQKYDWDATKGAETAEQLADFIILTNDIADAMSYGPYTNAFNSLSHENVQDRSRLRLLVRTGFKNKFRRARMTNPNPGEQLTLDIPLVEVPDFGGLEAYQDAEFTTKLYPVYDKLGHEIGFNTNENADAVTVQKKDVHWKDPNENIVAILADKGLVFEGTQNGYSIEPFRNPRGRYTNLWASSPNNTVAVDAIYNAVVITEGNGTALAKKRK